MLLFAVDSHALLQVIWVSLLAGVGVTTLFSVVVVVGARADDARRSGRDGAAMVYGVLAVIAVLVFLGGAALGVEVMLSK
jgi:hypothetical protein